MKYYQNKITGGVKKAPEGFSWTTLFFGNLPALFRGDIRYFFIQLFVAIITLGISWFVFPFVYNGMYHNKLAESGFAPISRETFEILTNGK